MKNKLTKIEKAVMLTQFMRVLNGEKFYTEDEVRDMQDRIKELEVQTGQKVVSPLSAKKVLK